MKLFVFQLSLSIYLHNVYFLNFSVLAYCIYLFDTFSSLYFSVLFTWICVFSITYIFTILYVFNQNVILFFFLSLSHTHIHPALLFLSSCRDTVSVFIQDYEWLSSQWGRPAKWNQSISSLFCFVNDTLFGKWLFPFKRFHLKWKCRTIENKNRPPKDVQRSGIG